MPDEQRRRDELAGQLERFNSQIGIRAAAKDVDGNGAKQLEELKGRRTEVQARLAELESELARKYPSPGVDIGPLDQIQAQIPADAALVGWLDLTVVSAADPRGDHWACVLRRTRARDGSGSWVTERTERGRPPTCRGLAK